MKTARLLLLAALVSLAASTLLAQQPRITGGTMRTLHASPNLASDVESAGRNGWIGYLVPGASTRSVFCTSWDNFQSSSRDDLRPAGSAPAVFFRVDEGRVTKVRLYSADCTLDADGREVIWLEGVDAQSSMKFLRTLLDRSERVSHSAVAALAIHANSTDALLDVAKHHPDRKVRSQALFWLSQQAGDKAAGALRTAIDDDPDTRVKEQAVFGISQLPDDQSIPLLVDLARTHRNASVRRKAIFWLGQKRDPRALAAIEELLK